MKLRSIVSSSLLCALLLITAVVATAQAPYASHPPGTKKPAVHLTHSSTPQVISPASGTWAKATKAPPVSMGSMLLLTDGRILVHSEPNCTGCTGNYNNWYTLTPDAHGSYRNGTWKQVASFPSGYSPLFFGSAVLADGKVVAQGGEYNCAPSCSAQWQSKGAIYDPTANTWTATTAPASSNIGDAQSVVLSDGTWMLAQCCAIAFGNSTFPVYYYFNESTLSFTAKSNSTDGKFDDFDEEGWNLLPNGQVLTVDAYTTNTVLTGTNSETYNPSANMWSTAGGTIKQLWDSNCKLGSGSFEVGPAVLRPDGTLFATGSSDCSVGHTAVYNSNTGVWTAGPDFPNPDAANDAPAALEINGNVIVEASNFSGTFTAPAHFYEWNGSTLTAINNPPNASSTPSFVGHLLGLPNGQIMYTDFTTDVEFYTPVGTFNTAWQPTITSVASTLTAGSTNNSISGTQFNGLSQANAYGDDYQDATNYPLVRITNNATSHVFYCKTHDHSTMGIATGSTIVSTNFDVPSGIETGTSQLVVIANGIPSTALAVTITSSSSDFSLSANPTSVTVAHGASGTSTITSTTTGGFNTPVVLSASGQPSGVTVTFNPTSITGTGTSTMTMAVGASVTPATYTITVTGKAGSTTHTTTVSLTVKGTTGSFTLAAKPRKVSVARGGRGAAKITATPSGGFNSTIALSASGKPAGVTVAFVPTSIVGGSGTASMRIRVSSTATTGTFTITITGKGGGVTTTTTITLTIT